MNARDCYVQALLFLNVVTLFLSEFEFNGSSAANIAEETMIQTSTMFPK